MGEEDIIIKKEFIKKLCDLAGIVSIDVDNVTQEDLADLLDAVKTKTSLMETMPQELLKELSKNVLDDEPNDKNSADMQVDPDFLKYGAGSSIDESENINSENRFAVLIVDDLGVIVHQLSIAFQKMNMWVVSAKEIFDALDKFKKQHFDLVIMDLFIPTDREGFMLLSEIKKVMNMRDKDTKIVVITASSKKEYRKLCLSRGADYFFEKTTGWQSVLAKTCLQSYYMSIAPKSGGADGGDSDNDSNGDA